jgi:hypothetical protein
MTFMFWLAFLGDLRLVAPYVQSQSRQIPADSGGGRRVLAWVVSGVW